MYKRKNATAKRCVMLYSFRVSKMTITLDDLFILNLLSLGLLLESHKPKREYDKYVLTWHISNPKVSKLYRSVVLPKAFYGCESWSNLSDSSIIQLERACRSCIKHIRDFCIRTHTDIALGLL